MSRRSIALIWSLLGSSVMVGLAGCDQPPAEAKANPPAASYTPDSVRQAQLAAFRGEGPAVEELEGGKSSREELVRSYLSALETRDTALLKSMLLTQAEFAWIYYPTTAQGRPPYDLEPGLLYFMLTQHSGKGLGKALETLGGKHLAYAGHTCDPTASHEGENTIYGPCLVRAIQAPGDTAEGRLFGLVIERHGRWKFVSYANKLD